MKRGNIKIALGFIFLVILFLLVSYFLSKNVISLEEYISPGYKSMILYFIIVASENILAPVSIIPLIPIASSLWGNFTTFLLTWTAWTIGSIIAFLIARKLGVSLIERITSVEEMNKYQRFIPDKNLFLGVIVIRIFIPLDIMSYAIGFFTDIDIEKYTMATLIGLAPSAFILSYFGDIPLKIFLILIIIGIIIVSTLIIFNKKLNIILNKLFKN